MHEDGLGDAGAEEDGAEESIDLKLLETDLPCIRCGYNLRGLKDQGRCPGCGARVRRSLRFAMERVLCVGCMAPNHPSAQRCANCGGPLNTAAAVSTYFQTQARGVRKKGAGVPAAADEEEEEKLPPSMAGVIVMWVIGFIFATCFGSGLSLAWEDERMVAIVVDGFITMMAIGFPVYVTVTYVRDSREYRRKEAQPDAQERDGTNTAEDGAETNAESVE